MSSLQVDSIAAIGGGHVDGTGEIVQYKQAVNTTATSIGAASDATILTLNFTPKFSDSLILVQGFHGQDSATTATGYCSSRIFLGTTEVCRANAVGLNITRTAGARFTYSYSGSIASWGTTPLEIDLRVASYNGNWIVSRGGTKTSLYVWEIAQ